MMPFIHDDFLLGSTVARDLYHRVAAPLPIIDYHCHLPAALIASDHRFRSITELWLEGDHYKWRAMRTNGLAEQYVSGDASDWEKFEAWAATVPYTLRNPLYHWTHMELRRPFGITTLLSPATAREVFDRCNEALARPAFSARGLLRQFRVALVVTTDDPADSLEHHRAIAAADPDTRVYPGWRPDRALAVDDPAAFKAWVDRLEAAADCVIATFDDFIEALDARHQAIHDAGCRVSDHGLERVEAEPWSDAEVEGTFEAARAGRGVAAGDAVRYRSAMLHRFAVMNNGRGWMQQYHLGALRNTNTRLFHAVGADAGCDSIGDLEMARPLARFLDGLDRRGQLARTVVYNLNPRDNELIASVIGSFQDGSLPGKLQYGAAWWFLDQKDGIEAQIRALSNLGLFSRFIGMLTDSRSFLSYSRHEYFRRLVCDLLGRDVEAGLVPRDQEMLDEVVRGVCYLNAREWLGLEVGRLAGD
ncbi:MAG TPA: glucuronate isomerase [Vicinamibacterales bacterium]|nr:glucuronate isomerase [Vicinamibacterales bacterium]